ncbi:hypothetical protein [Xanthomonas phage JGB6]|nr:hypothetical protein [Xanthomonas phage JGB6]
MTIAALGHALMSFGVIQITSDEEETSVVERATLITRSRKQWPAIRSCRQ